MYHLGANLAREVQYKHSIDKYPAYTSPLLSPTQTPRFLNSPSSANPIPAFTANMKSSTLVVLRLGSVPQPEVLISLPAPARQAALFTAKATVLTDSGSLWLCDARDQWVPRCVDTGFVVKSVACDEEIALAVSAEGRVFAWGRDSRQGGIFAIPGVYASDVPVQIPDLPTSPITSVSLGPTHAAAIDRIPHTGTGKLYAWGTGHIGELGGSLYTETHVLPRVVEGTRAFTMKKVLCAKERMAVCTSGGFVYVFGRFAAHGDKAPGSGRQQNRPKAPSHFEDVYAADICLGPGFLAFLTESGQVYAFDDCLELVSLPILGDSKVHSVVSTSSSLLGLSSTLHTESGGMLHIWSPSVLRHNERELLNSLVCDEKVPCSLYTWKGELYLLDEPWDSCTKVFGSNSDALAMQLASTEGCDRPLGEIAAEAQNAKLMEYAEKLMETCSQPVELQSPLEVSDSDAPSADAGKAFGKVLRARLAEQQGALLRKSFARVLIKLFALTIANIKESKGMHRLKKRAAAIEKAANAVFTTIAKAVIHCKVDAFQEVQAFSELRLAELIRTAQQHKAAKYLLESLSAAVTANNYAVQFHFIVSMAEKVRKYQRFAVLLPRVGRTASSSALRTQRLAVKVWRELIVRAGMRKWGVNKLGRTLRRVAISHSWVQISSYLHRKSLCLSTLDRLLRRHLREQVRQSQSHSFTIWKHLSYQYSTHRLSQLQALQVSFKAVHHALRRVLRGQVYQPVFATLYQYVCAKTISTHWRHPLMFFSSIFDKIHTRACSWAFNNMRRFSPQAVKASLRQQQKALKRVGFQTLRNAFRSVIAFSKLRQQQSVVDFVYNLQEVVDRMENRSVVYAFSLLDLYSDLMKPKERDDCLVELGESHDGALSHYYSGTRSDFSEIRLLNPEETGRFLGKDGDSEDNIARPLELTTGSNTTKHLTPRKETRSFDRKMTVGSPTTYPQKPPWRAPSRSGLPKPVTNDSIIRRRQYDSVLKERLAKKWGVLDSPLLRSAQVKKGLIELVSADQRRKPMDKNSQTLCLIVGIRALQKARRRYLSFGWSALSQATPQRRPKHRALTVTPSLNLSQEDCPDSAELESMWKSRLIGLGALRLSQLLDHHRKLLAYSTLLEVKGYMIFG